MRIAVLVLALLAAGPAAAQTREGLPRFAIDLHGAWVGLPTAEGWIPAVDAATPVPGRAWGLSGGANVYLLKLGVMTLGAGAHVATGRGKGDSLTITSGSGSTATTRTTPAVITQITSLLPHLSMNFGHKLGWSYLSVGYGRTKVSSSASAAGTTPGIVVPEAWNPALNFGGGAKWFMKPHLGASFDVRFTKLSSRGATETLPSAKRTQMITMSVGISIQ
ncbi:MAG: hypothetical protein A3J29_15165 [Acidobacteria bacterium RIFCSPLOWO2_12_FULL_67_14b]|nr:MAG: hypothetical protein A3J29_15165 [Acidobacteria bacterium RIFCSPLOWO2_12_FULL_67_14b]